MPHHSWGVLDKPHLWVPRCHILFHRYTVFIATSSHPGSRVAISTSWPFDTDLYFESIGTRDLNNAGNPTSGAV